MTQTRRTLNPAQIALNFLLFIVLISTGTAWAKNKGAARASKEKRPAARQQSARNDRSSRAQREREKEDEKEFDFHRGPPKKSCVSETRLPRA